MSRMLVGVMEPREITVQAEAYRQMAKVIEQAGLYKQNPSYYYLLYAYLAAVYLATWALVCNQQILLASLTIGIFWGQVGRVMRIMLFLQNELNLYCL